MPGRIDPIRRRTFADEPIERIGPVTRRRPDEDEQPPPRRRKPAVAPRKRPEGPDAPRVDVRC